SRRQWTGYDGFFFDEFAADSAWIRDQAFVCLPALAESIGFVVRGEFRPHSDARGLEKSPLGADFFVDGRKIAAFDSLQPGLFSVRFTVAGEKSRSKPVLRIRLRGAGLTNFLAWLGRVGASWPMLRFAQRFRLQNKNRQFRVARVETSDGEVVFDFSNRYAAFSPEFARRHARLGINIAGFLTADLGIGESARCMVRAADAAGLPAALIDVKLHCKNRRGDPTYSSRLQKKNPHDVNIVHLDPPASPSLDRFHPNFRRGKYNIAYWAWELPDFPDAWTPYCDYFDEIWCPSDFTRAAISAKSPLPVFTMPHAISFPRPTETAAVLRARFGLPLDKFLFLFLYDLNSTSARKNP
ncbi:MAG: hypothetical protein KGJ37_07855, partial [Verrucomicrobiota bacterium]|nr:hypothetical protein [Verrucomicrobiota bacterium]